MAKKIKAKIDIKCDDDDTHDNLMDTVGDALDNAGWTILSVGGDVIEAETEIEDEDEDE